MHKTIEQARVRVVKYIETFYNAKKNHQIMKCLTLDEFEKESSIVNSNMVKFESPPERGQYRPLLAQGIKMVLAENNDHFFIDNRRDWNRTCMGYPTGS